MPTETQNQCVKVLKYSEEAWRVYSIKRDNGFLKCHCYAKVIDSPEKWYLKNIDL